MVLDNDIFSWRRACLWASLAWVALGLAALTESRLPGNTPWLPMVAPLLVVFLAGARERGGWWCYGSLLTLVPSVMLLAWMLVSLAIGDSAASPGAEMALGMLLVAGPLVIGCGAVAVAIAAALGVWAGRKLEARGKTYEWRSHVA